MTKKIYDYCYDEKNRDKTAEEITNTFQNTIFLIEDLISRFKWLKARLQKKKEKTPEESEIITKLKSLIFFSTERGGLSAFILNWESLVDSYVRRVLNIWINEDEAKGLSLIGVLKSWAHIKAVDNTAGILQVIKNQELAIAAITSRKHVWINNKDNPYPLNNIDWEQIVRSLVQTTPLFNTLTIGRERKSIDLTNLNGEKAPATQIDFMKRLFLILAEEFDNVEGGADDAIIDVGADCELPRQGQLSAFCSTDELIEIRDRIISLGNRAYTIPMMLSVSCWADCDWILRTEVCPKLFSNKHSNTNGNTDYAIFQEDSLDAEIEIRRTHDYLVRQRRSFRIIYCKTHQGTEGKTTIVSPRDMPAIAHVVFQFTIYPSQKHEWAGEICVYSLIIHKRKHIDPLIQMFNPTSVDRGDAGVVV